MTTRAPKPNETAHNHTITTSFTRNVTTHEHSQNTTASPQFLNTSSQHTQCGVNEEYARCVPHCQTTCRGVQECTGHGTTCTSGCTCKPGFRRNGRGKCVLPKYCYLAPGCKNNETWTKCATCERKCAATIQVCTICYSGCECNEGYARNLSNLCTRVEDCN
ncbi:trypsin Inhibitor like cysteine rich domain protein [Teladorsagia circumcincta]|uniref:Trypsin Inhibitor like cysteine rich domain protein n=1 Tax=Teladorsagia circumcincta TaxID=45464 RepID=A0A2G9UIK4_TELCI|nr:trypsin Inhibitor like cysteine rich domain protein [Teladorsagia circumcincta]